MDIMNAIKRMLRLLCTVLTIALLLAVVVWLVSIKPLDAAETVINNPINEISVPNTPTKKILKFNKNKKKQYKPRNKNPIKKPTTKNIS